MSLWDLGCCSITPWRRKRGRWHTSSSRFCLQVLFVTSIHVSLAKASHKAVPSFKGSGESNQEFGQVASVTALHVRCPCPSGPLSPQHTTQMLVSEPGAECSSTSCPGARVLGGLPWFLTCLQYTPFLFFPSQRSAPSFERCSSHLLSSVQMCSDQGRPGFSSH